MVVGVAGGVTVRKTIKSIITYALVACCSVGVLLGSSCGKAEQARQTEIQDETTLNIVATPLSELEAVNLGVTTTSTESEYETLKFLLEVKVVNYVGTPKIRWSSWTSVDDVDLSEYVNVVPLANGETLQAYVEFYKPFPKKVIFINAILENDNNKKMASWYFYSENPEE